MKKFVKYFSEKICKAEEKSALHRSFPRPKRIISCSAQTGSASAAQTGSASADSGYSD